VVTALPRSRHISLLLALFVLFTVGLVSISPRPAHAYQNFNNALVADQALSEVGTSRPTGWDQPGECIKSAQRWVNNADGYFGGGGVVSGYTSSGATEVNLGAAAKGDIIQYTRADGSNNDWTYAHTVVVVQTRIRE
jgi:hypothetical protein